MINLPQSQYNRSFPIQTKKPNLDILSTISNFEFKAFIGLLSFDTSACGLCCLSVRYDWPLWGYGCLAFDEKRGYVVVASLLLWRSSTLFCLLSMWTFFRYLFLLLSSLLNRPFLIGPLSKHHLPQGALLGLEQRRYILHGHESRLGVGGHAF